MDYGFSYTLYSVTPGDVTDESDGEASDKSDDEGCNNDDRDPPNLKTVNWLRKIKLRPDGSRNDAYYYEEGKIKRLRSLNDVEGYCKKNNIVFQPGLFDFKGSNNFNGLVSSNIVSSVDLTNVEKA